MRGRDPPLPRRQQRAYRRTRDGPGYLRQSVDDRSCFLLGAVAPVWWVAGVQMLLFKREIVLAADTKTLTLPRSGRLELAVPRFERTLIEHLVEHGPFT